MTGEITINNLSDKVIENWQIEMEFPQEITNIWNAEIVSNENKVYNIKNAGGNNAVNIPIGVSVTFGFTGTCEDEIISPQNVRLVTGKANAEDESYCIDYKLLSDWGSGYSAQIIITNNSDAKSALSRTAVLYTLGYLYEHREEADHHDLTLTLRSLLFSLREGVF